MCVQLLGQLYSELSHLGSHLYPLTVKKYNLMSTCLFCTVPSQHFCKQCTGCVLYLVPLLITYASYLRLSTSTLCTYIIITSWLLVYPTPLPPAAQAPGSGSLAGAVVGACIGTALLYTVVLLVVIFALLLWNKRHRSALFSKAINTCGIRHV